MNATAPNPAGEDFDKLVPFTEAMGEVRTIVEVGCHRMQDTARMRRRWPHAAIYAFECDRRALEFIERHSMAEELDVRLSGKAVGSGYGSGPLWRSTNLSPTEDGDWTASSSLRQPRLFGNPADLSANPCIFEQDACLVEIVPLDGFLPYFDSGRGPDSIDLLWIDSQGYEDEVLKGATETLKRTRFIFMEHNTDGVYQNAPCLADLLALLPGWEVIATLPYDVLLKNKGDYPLTPSK